MAHNLREQSQWRKEKAPIVRQYVGDHNKLMSEIAGRGFLNLPGYAYDLENELELRLKLGLSEINYKILSETIERELKQQGIDYNLQHRNAAMAWEVEKQALMAAWDAELAGIKQGIATEEEILNRLAQEIAARQIYLIEAKTEIDLEMEGYRLTLAQLDGQTAPYEVQLANAKVLTAQKKLEVIPILQEIISKERDLLVLEQGKAIEYTALMNIERQIAIKQNEIIPTLQTIISKEQELLALEAGKAAEYTTLVGVEGQIADKQGEIITALENVIAKEYELLPFEEQKAQESKNLLQVKQENAIKKQLLVPWYLELANLNQAYAGLIPGQLGIEMQIAQEKIAQAQAIIEKEQNKLEEMDLEIDTIGVNVEQLGAKRDLQQAKTDNEIELIDKEVNNENTYQNELIASNDEYIESERELVAKVISNTKEKNDIKRETNEDSATGIYGAQVTVEQTKVAAEKYAIEQTAIIESAGNITAKLTHLIG